MKIVALVHPALDVDAAARVFASAAGCTVAEARVRLAPEPPALLARVDDAAAAELVARLAAAGLSVVTVDAAADGSDRVVARTVSLGGDALTLTARDRAPVTLAWTDVTAVLRGATSARALEERTTTATRFSAGRAIATGGLALRRETTETVRTASEETEQVIFVAARGGALGVLRETFVDFRCLGAAMQPSRTANVAALAAALYLKTPDAFHDERLVRLGRRSVPFASAESTVASGASVTTRTSTAGGLDLLVRVMLAALAAELLP